MIRTLLLMLTAGALFAQSQPAFEVADVKPSAPLNPDQIMSGKAHIGTKIDASRVDIGTASLFRLICTAYRLKPYQLSGPDWLKTANFDIQAKIPPGSTVEQLPEMLQALLAERFGLKAHRESKEQPVYALVVAKGGPKMRESTPETPATPSTAEAPNLAAMSVPTLIGDVKVGLSDQGITMEMPGGELAGKIRVTQGRGGGSAPPKLHLESPGTTMKAFAEMLTLAVDRPVLDFTELTGAYDVAIDVSREDAITAARAAVTFLPSRNAGGGDPGKGAEVPGGSLADPTGSSVFASVQNLGLRLEPRKLPLDTLVVDHAEKTPTAN